MKEIKNTYEPNDSKEEVKLGILHNVNGYWVSCMAYTLCCAYVAV